MPGVRTFQGNFVGGELSPEMFGRIDDAKFRCGAASLENMIATALGPAEKRPGFAFVATTKNNGLPRLIPFTYSVTQTVVIEMGNQYFRFHTMGKTLVYSTAGAEAWVPPSGDISLSYTSPTIVTWAAHGLTTGDPLQFYMYGGHSSSELPAGFQVGYTYTANVLDANTFQILDNGAPVALVGGGGGASTNYPGTGTASATMMLAPNSKFQIVTSSVLSGLASTVVPGGAATLNLGIDSKIFSDGGSVGAGVGYEYSTGSGWNTLYTSTATETTTVAVQIPISNIDQLQIRTSVWGRTLSGQSLNVTGTISSWSVDVPTGAGSALTIVRAYRYYTAGDITSYAGSYYTSTLKGGGGVTVPGTDATIWAVLPADLTYEVPSPYAAADLAGIHYVQSADVLTLVHPNYPPAELQRLGPTQWAYAPIVFGQTLPAPTGVAVTPVRGYEAVVASVSSGTGGQALFQTVANHTLALGDGVYIESTGSGGLNGFYMVELVPSDGDGNLIPNELYLMDYSGNPVMYGAPALATVGGIIQYGTQIVDITNTYVVSAIAADGIQQSPTSAPVSVLNNLYVTGSYNTITWDAVPGANNYYVYKMKFGLYGFIGQTAATTLTLSDTNIGVDMSLTPDINDPVFGSAGNYPGAVSYCQQRRAFGGTDDAPQNLWMTKTGTESDMSYSLPVQDTDRIAIAVATRELSTILHIIPLLELILLTSSCEISASPSAGAVITPSTISANPQSYIGSTAVQPSVVNNQMLFCAARGGHVREMGYQWQIGGYVTGDVSLRAAHLFDGFEIADQACMKTPWQVVWFVSSNGNLLGFTYVPEEGVGAWHHHTTDGEFQNVAVVAEGIEDHLYAVVTRQINGQTVNCVERMGSRIYGEPDFPWAPERAFYVDCGGSFDGTNTTATTMTVTGGTTWGPEDTLTLYASAAAFASTDPGSVVVLTGADGVTLYRFTVKDYVSATAVTGVIDKVLEVDLQSTATAVWAWARPIIEGLTWLVGKTVNVLVDGAVQPSCVVQADGSITLERPGVVVQAGLPYTAEIDTLPVNYQFAQGSIVGGYGQGTQKNVNEVWIKVYNSGSIFVGPAGGSLVEYKQRTDEAYGAPPALMTKEIPIVIPPLWAPDGRLTLSQSNPLPLTVVGITAEVSTGG